MAVFEYWHPDGSGPFFTDDAEVIPPNELVLLLGNFTLPVIIRGTEIGQILWWMGDSWVYAEVANLIWDDANKRLGIGNDTPEEAVDVGGNIRVSGHIKGLNRAKQYFFAGF